GRAADVACVEARLRDVLAAPALGPVVSFVMPASATLVDEPFAPEIGPALARAVAAAGAEVVRRDAFTTPHGVRVLERVVVRKGP
ncbi:MAG TPA: hypothetical protein VHB21_26435, partial [Minicystis sp.]|nr:hypothetical protein [Minicystis sp.]